MDQGHTTKLKTIWLACEMFREDQFGLMIYDHITKQPWPYDFNDYPLTQVLVERMREWYNKYYPLTSSTAQELEKESGLIDTLDKEVV